METLRQILIQRDGMTVKEADAAILEAESRVLGGADPEEILMEEFGLEPDYVMELICGATAGRVAWENLSGKLCRH